MQMAGTIIRFGKGRDTKADMCNRYTHKCNPQITIALSRSCEELAIQQPGLPSGTYPIYPVPLTGQNCITREACEKPTYCQFDDIAGFGSGWTVGYLD